MSQTKTEASTTLPEQNERGRSMSFDSLSTSAGESSLKVVQHVLIHADVEPSTSNQASFGDDEAAGARVGFPEPCHSRDLSCVGSGFHEDVDEIPHHDRPRKRTLSKSEDSTLKKQARFEKGAHNAAGPEIVEGEGHMETKDTSSTVHGDDGTIGHTQSTGAEVEDDDAAVGKKN